jgi:site-specific DNA-methyltransferase (adenine-specific)
LHFPKPYATLLDGRRALRFYHGDSIDLLGRFPAASVDVIVTSPPYNLGISYRSYDDGQPRDEYLKWTGDWVKAAARTLSAGGSLFLNVGAKPTDPWTALDVAQAARAHLQLQNLIHWIKSISIDAETAGARAALTDTLSVGHYKPINSDRFLNDCHEFVFHFSPEARTPLERLALGVKYQDASNITRWQRAGGGLRCRGNTWFIPYETIQSRDRDRPHPATFPPRLPEYCVRLHGRDRAGVVMDPFLGLGSTAVAAARLGVGFIGIEMDEHYLRESIARAEREVAAV